MRGIEKLCLLLEPLWYSPLSSPKYQSPGLNKHDVTHTFLKSHNRFKVHRHFVTLGMQLAFIGDVQNLLCANIESGLLEHTSKVMCPTIVSSGQINDSVLRQEHKFCIL
jgi:hypothetical protein